MQALGWIGAILLMIWMGVRDARGKATPSDALVFVFNRFMNVSAFYFIKAFFLSVVVVAGIALSLSIVYYSGLEL